MNEGILLYRGNNDAEFRGPVNVREPVPAAFDTITGDSVVATARLYNTGNDTVTVDLVGQLTAAVVAGIDVIPLSAADALGWGVGDSVQVDLGLGLVDSTTLSAVGAASVTLTDVLTAAASENAVIRRVAMATTGKYFCVDEIGSWKIGLKMIAVLDTMADDAEATVDQVIPKGETQRCNLIRVNTAPATAISSGREIRNPVGGTLTGEDFGSAASPPVVGDPATGFRYPILPAHLELALEMHVRAEMKATDTAGIVARRNEFATVKEVA